MDNRGGGRAERGFARRYRRLLRYARYRGLAFAGIVALTLVAALVAALQPWPIKVLVDYALGDVALPLWLNDVVENPSIGATTVLIVCAGALSVALFAATSALDVALTLLWSATGQRMVYDFAEDLFDRLCALKLTFHARQPVGDSLSRLSIDTHGVFAVFQGVLVAPIRHTFTLLTVAALAWSLDPQLTVVAFVIVPVMVFAARYVGVRVKARAKAEREAQSKIMSLVQCTMGAIPIVQSFRAERRNRREFERLAAASVARTQRSVLLLSGLGFMNGFLMTVGAAIVLFFGSQRVLAGAISLGSLLVFVAYLQTIRSALLGLVSLYANLKVTQASVDRVIEILDSGETIDDHGSHTLTGGSRGGCIGDVRLENVTAGYEAGRAVLDCVTLDAQAGETVALVGPTGSGKSTLVSLLPRFLDPWDGRVLVGGQDIRDVRLSSLRKHIGLVLQQPFLLPVSVAENIGYGRPGAHRADIVAAARSANADEFIQCLPDGYDTVLGAAGATLSGGERQRLSIARALLKDAPILILDEPTSALDAETEKSLMTALIRLMRGRTTFVIAHRLSTVRHADRIIVLDKGCIVESGRHDELMAANGHYQRAYGLQFSQTPAMGAA